MLNPENIRVLKAQFASARVPLRLADAPFVRGVRNAAIVQMDIQNRSKRGHRSEEVVIWPGGAERLEVLGIDPSYQQVVLLVKEPEVAFEERVLLNAREVTRQRRTSGGVRRFLIGMDEQHLFIAPLSTAAGSVAEAHAQLQPRAVAAARARDARVVRQGEWFFVAADDKLQAHIAAQVRRWGVERHVAIGSPWHVPATGSDRRAHFDFVARGHFVDERVVLRLPAATGPEAPERWECVRGHVRHPDHKVLVLKGWHCVQRNTEAVAGTLAREGFVHTKWVD